MKRFNRILSLVLAVVMLAGTATTVQGESSVDILFDQDWSQYQNMEDWIKWSRLCNEIPDEHTDYFTDMLSLPYDNRGFLELTGLIAYAGNNEIVVSLKGCTNTCVAVQTNAGALTLEESAFANVYTMIVDRETNSPISVRNLGNMPCGQYDAKIAEIKSINIRLPDNFNNQKHKLIFFFHYFFPNIYSVNNNFRFIDEIDKLFDKNDQSFAISEPVEADLSGIDNYGNGDANADGILNLADATMVLKHIAGWNIDGFIETNADVNCTGKTEVADAVILLKKIAGWQNEKTTSKYFFKKLYSPLADEEYKERQIEYIDNRVFYYCDNKTANEIEQSLVNLLAELKYYGFSFEIIEKCILSRKFCETLCEYNSWTETELIKFMKQVYDAIKSPPPGGDFVTHTK